MHTISRKRYKFVNNGNQDNTDSDWIENQKNWNREGDDIVQTEVGNPKANQGKDSRIYFVAKRGKRSAKNSPEETIKPAVVVKQVTITIAAKKICAPGQK